MQKVYRQEIKTAIEFTSSVLFGIYIAFFNKVSKIYINMKMKNTESKELILKKSYK